MRKRRNKLKANQSMNQEIKKFKVNKYITVRLVKNSIFSSGETTIIYINNKGIDLCKFLMVNKPIEKVRSPDAIEYIDEAAETLGWTIKGQKGIQYNIDPESEFWGYCSNLQVWAENSYNTRFLHSTIAFPLLKKLSKAGDPIAKSVFKKEIVKRFESGYPPVIIYLLLQGYLKYLSKEEIASIFKELDLSIITNLKYKVSFPLLKKLNRTGNPIIEKLFREEIAKKFTSETASAANFLINQGYLNYLSKKELTSVLDKFDFTKISNSSIESPGALRLLNRLEKEGDPNIYKLRKEIAAKEATKRRRARRKWKKSPTYKIVVFGDGGVGKTNLLYYYNNLNRWKDSFKIEKINSKNKKSFRFIGHSDPDFRHIFAIKDLIVEEKKVRLRIFNPFRDRHRLFDRFFGASGGLFMYDITNYSSLTHIDEWLKIVKKAPNPLFPIVVVGAKSDLSDEREVLAEEGRNITKSRGLDAFIECSCKTGENVEEVLKILTRFMLQRDNLI